MIMPKTRRIGIVCLTILAAMFFYGKDATLTGMVVGSLLTLIDPNGGD